MKKFEISNDQIFGNPIDSAINDTKAANYLIIEIKGKP